MVIVIPRLLGISNSSLVLCLLVLKLHYINKINTFLPQHLLNGRPLNIWTKLENISTTALSHWWFNKLISKKTNLNRMCLIVKFVINWFWVSSLSISSLKFLLWQGLKKMCEWLKLIWRKFCTTHIKNKEQL